MTLALNVLAVREPGAIMKQTDIVILVLGVTGVGKSTFIRTLLNDYKDEESVKTGQLGELTSCTTKLQPIIFQLPDDPFNGRRLVVLDTPGFNNTWGDRDYKIWGDINVWLKSSYGDSINFGGIIYLRDERKPYTDYNRLQSPYGLADDVFKTITLEVPKSRATPIKYLYGSIQLDAQEVVNSILEMALYPQNPKRLNFKKFKNKRRKPGQTHGCSTDFIVLVVGPPGAGKSTFINTLVGKEILEISERLELCTRKLQPVISNISNGPLDGHRLVMVDTPGADNYRGVLQSNNTWLRRSYGADMKLGGVIYIYNVSQKAPQYPDDYDLGILRKLLGDDDNPLQFVILGEHTHGGNDMNREVRGRSWIEHNIEGRPTEGKTFQFQSEKRSSAWEMVKFLMNQHKCK